MVLAVNHNDLTKAEILERLNFRCKHSHNGFVHPVCFAKEKGFTERIGCIDIECSGLVADFAVMLCWCINPLDGGKILNDALCQEDVQPQLAQFYEYVAELERLIKAGKQKEAKSLIKEQANAKVLTPQFDKRIVASCIDAMRGFDRLVGHYSCKMDIPFIRTRALRWGLDFPKYGEIYHSDTWLMARSKLRLSSNRQGSVARAIQGKDIKTKIWPDLWINVLMTQDASKIASVLDHCKKDVVQLKKNFLKLAPFVRLAKTSI